MPGEVVRPIARFLPRLIRCALWGETRWPRSSTPYFSAVRIKVLGVGVGATAKLKSCDIRKLELYLNLEVRVFSNV